MKRSMILLVFATMSYFSAGSFGQDTSDIAEGARVWANNCTRCHVARSPMERNDRDWKTIVAHMRARANLTKTEARLVTLYLTAMNGSEQRVADTSLESDRKASISASTRNVPGKHQVRFPDRNNLWRYLLSSRQLY